MTRPAFADIFNLAEPLPQLMSEANAAAETVRENEGEDSTAVDTFIAKRRKRRRRD